VTYVVIFWGLVKLDRVRKPGVLSKAAAADAE
jgi:hypothetical protein